MSEIIVTSPTTATIVAATRGPQGAQGPAGTQPVFFRSGNIDTQTGASRFYIENAGTLATVRASVGVPATGAPIIVDVLKNGTSVFTDPSHRPTIPAGENTATAAPDVTEVDAGDFLTVNIDQVGSINAGADLTVSVTIQ